MSYIEQVCNAQERQVALWTYVKLVWLVAGTRMPTSTLFMVLFGAHGSFLVLSAVVAISKTARLSAEGVPPAGRRCIVGRMAPAPAAEKAGAPAMDMGR